MMYGVYVEYNVKSMVYGACNKLPEQTLLFRLDGGLVDDLDGTVHP